MISFHNIIIFYDIRIFLVKTLHVSKCIMCNTKVLIYFIFIYIMYLYIISCSASPEHYRCNLQWSDDRTLLIGWVDIVRVCHIRKRTMQEMVNRDLPEFVVDPGN